MWVGRDVRVIELFVIFFFSSRRRHTRYWRDWSSDVCSSDLPARGYDLRLIPPVPLPRKPTLDLLRVPGRVARSVSETRALLRALAADVVVGFGGYVSLPAYLAARLERVPVVVHEQNALPGLANRVGARIAERVAVTVPGTPLRGAEQVGMPLRTADRKSVV